MRFDPGVAALTCPYCGHQQTLPDQLAVPEELDLNAFLEHAASDAQTQSITLVKCDQCGASVEPESHVTATECAFCGAAMNLREISQRQIKPSSLLPFAVEKKAAANLFKEWVASRWFAPSALTAVAQREAPMQGIYIPYWTFDSQTHSEYDGQRGDYYTETRIVNGEEKEERKIEWTYVSGRISEWFDDVLIMASTALPREVAQELEPWDLENLVVYDAQYTSGFRAQNYQVDLQQGFELADERMEAEIRELVEQDIGGDRQRIDSLNVRHYDVTFKHILLPIWIHTYRMGDKSYQCLINGRTGEVSGERPYSWVKILFAALVALGLVGAAVWGLSQYGKSQDAAGQDPGYSSWASPTEASAPNSVTTPSAPEGPSRGLLEQSLAPQPTSQAAQSIPSDQERTQGGGVLQRALSTYDDAPAAQR
ncbi:hypothetical protein [Magnetofaba australis]|uniref:Primosomal protein N' (Replication factor Y)-superfamily II helicase n=1 Tax=Magnetofaba australis IT-1 TaxID=1434232 RepID=A0A1Y2K5K1_9PROT|nr:hypothetical protein [Magnetofaba australis]OSM04294.1 hypothetical protein MAIT1_04168 [Magnetofaba australis IT-1]